METVTITILEPKAEAMLDEMQNENLIKISKRDLNGGERKPRTFGSMRGLVVHIADDFDAPLEDFKEYM